MTNIKKCNVDCSQPKIFLSVVQDTNYNPYKFSDAKICINLQYPK